MINEKFAEIMKSNTGCAVVMAGSGSDKEHIDEVIESLRKYKVPFAVRICSAHKQPDKLSKMIDEYHSVGGSVTYVAVAGGTDALSGTLSFHALGPVISCPPDAHNQSCLTNPPGSSNAYIANPNNVGKFIAQMYAGVNPEMRKALEEEKGKKIRLLEEDDLKFKEKGQTFFIDLASGGK